MWNGVYPQYGIYPHYVVYDETLTASIEIAAKCHIRFQLKSTNATAVTGPTLLYESQVGGYYIKTNGYIWVKTSLYWHIMQPELLGHTMDGVQYSEW